MRRGETSTAAGAATRRRTSVGAERPIGNIGFHYGTIFGGLGMNRVIVFGIAVFFAVVGIALLGGEKQAVAGHGCNGCHGAVACDGGGCGGCAAMACNGYRGRCLGRARCHGRTGCLGRARRCGGRRCFGRRHCGGQPVNCCGQVVVTDCGGAVTGQAMEEAPTEAAPPAPAKE
jgi:hypothetical protein